MAYGLKYQKKTHQLSLKYNQDEAYHFSPGKGNVSSLPITIPKDNLMALVCWVLLFLEHMPQL